MGIDRRALLGAVGLGVAGASLAQAQTPQPAAPAPSASERIATAAQANRHRLEYDGARFSGAAWERMVREGAAAHAFLIGEEHGIAENPKLAAQLFQALRPAGYSKVCVEIAPTMAALADDAARGGVEGLRTMFADPGSQLAFFGMREEAEWLAAARAAAPARGQAIWGLDYDVGADRRMIAMLTTKRMPRAARAALAELEAASTGLWAQYAESRSPQHIFNFAGDPALVRNVRAAWPRLDADSQLILETLEETLEINRLFLGGRGQESNQRRNDFNKRNLLRYWRAEDAPPKVLYKFGGSHMVRGLSHTFSFDIGTLVPELVGLAGGRAYHMLVLPGAGRPVARFNPSTWAYESALSEGYSAGLAPLTGAAFEDAMTLIDTRPLRPLVTGNRARALDDELVRVIHGFDAVLVMTGSTPSQNL